VQGAPTPDADLNAQWEVVDAFLAAARDGDFDRLVSVLHPDIVLRADGGAVTALSEHLRGAENVASQAMMWSRVELTSRRALINGAAGMVAFRDGQPFSIAALTIIDGRIVEMNFLADPERIARLDVSVLED
jgi:RNA polymerase sigma-70 factor (ECF subfamily)